MVGEEFDVYAVFVVGETYPIASNGASGLAGAVVMGLFCHWNNRVSIGPAPFWV